MDSGTQDPSARDPRRRKSGIARSLWVGCWVGAMGLLPQGISSGGEVSSPQPPMAPIVPYSMEEHGRVRVDNYYWLKDRGDPEVLEYLRAENAYADTMMAHTHSLQETLFEEIKGRIKQTDTTATYKRGDYYYYTRYEAGKEYAIRCRRKGSVKADEQVLLDENLLAAGHDFFDLGDWVLTERQDLLAYSADTVGRRFYAVHFKDLTTGELLPDVIPNVTSSMEWANDGRTLFYVRQDPETLRWYRVYRHVLGTNPADDVLVFEETDETFSCWLYKTKSRRFIVIQSDQTLSTEARYLDANDPEGSFTVFLARERRHEYRIDHDGENFYVRTNWNARNFRLMRVASAPVPKERWEEVIPHREDVLLEGFELFRDYLVVGERHDGLIELRICPHPGCGEHYVMFEEPAYVAWIGTNYELDTPVLRYVYMSMTTPRSEYDYNMDTGERILVKRVDILGGFDPADYRTERLWADAPDSVKVPISIVYRVGLERNGRNPLLLDGYGAYGASSDPYFSASRLSLLDRGFVYGIAHVRGGEDLGRAWYEDGRLLHKRNTFTDFIACAEHLVQAGYTSPDKLYAVGGSAGGLLIGAVMNMRPDLFAGMVAQVPFVDVLTTMLDPSIPLTTGEYDEWGDPNEKQYYDYILSYSPYDNVEAKDYPNLLVETSLQDSQVQYWEPAKWVAKLRATKTGSNIVLLRTIMEAGHGGVSGRYRQYRETAFEYAFLLDLAGIRE
jgi:oligopeptidase B